MFFPAFVRAGPIPLEAANRSWIQLQHQRLHWIGHRIPETIQVKVLPETRPLRQKGADGCFFAQGKKTLRGKDGHGIDLHLAFGCIDGGNVLMVGRCRNPAPVDQNADLAVSNAQGGDDMESGSFLIDLVIYKKSPIGFKATRDGDGSKTEGIDVGW